MPSTSPGSHAPTTSTPFEHILPGKPVTGYQSISTCTHRYKRYIAYISGKQLSILSAPTVLLQAITFGEALVCVTADPKTGKIAVASEAGAWVLEPVTEGWSKIWWEKALYLRKEDVEDKACCLSWGGDGELLIGGSRHLSLFSTAPRSRSSSPPFTPLDNGDALEERRPLWSKDVSSPVRWAAFSPTANLIATCGGRDRLVKIWRRLSFEEGLFDHTFLLHPGAITHLQWRPVEEGFEERRGSGKSGRHDDDPEVLHTIANDGVLRIWRTGGIHDLDILVLHAFVDLVAAIPQSPSLSNKTSAPTPKTKSARYACTIPSAHFVSAVKAAVGLQTPEAKLSHSLEHLKEVSSKEPNITITLDGHGRMSAWGLQSIGHKRRPDTPSGASKQAFHIAHCEDLPLRFAEGENAVFEVWFEDAALNVLSHGFEGEVQWWRGETETFFSPAASGKERLQQQAMWSGMQDSIRELRALSWDDETLEMISNDGLSRTASKWAFTGPSAMQHLSSSSLPGNVTDAVELLSLAGSVCVEGEEAAITLRASSEQVLDERRLGASAVSGRTRIFTTSLSVKPGWLSQRFVVLGKTNDDMGCGCTFMLSKHGSSFDDFDSFTLESSEGGGGLLQSIAVLDPEQPDRFGIVGLTNNGHLHLYHVDAVACGEKVEPMLMASFESGTRPTNTWTANNEFAALTSDDGTELTVVDLRDGYVEHRQRFADPVLQLCSAEKMNVLAVGSKVNVDVIAQGRYASKRPTWDHIRQVSVAGTGLNVSSLAWLRNGSLAVAAGNGAFVTSAQLSVQELSPYLREALDLDVKKQESSVLTGVAAHLKTPHPVWHPELLTHLVQSGRWSLTADLVAGLLEKLKFWSEGEHLDPQLDLPPHWLFNGHKLERQETLDQDLMHELHQQLEEKNLPQLSRMEQAHLRRVLDAMLFCAEHVRGLDTSALRFLFAWKLAILGIEADRPDTNGALPNGHPSETPAPEMHWREITFAHQSNTQQPLLDILTLAYDNKISWRTARHLGLFAWLSDREALASIFEALAQSAYRASSPPDPINASLYFLALHKKSTLLGLWRIATWHKEQKATMNFLRRDFTAEANRTAARKNAYALMGKRRFDYAAAFFLLAEDAASATSVLAGQCGDVMLAIAVARLYAGDGSPVLRKLVEDRLLPDALTVSDRWQASWCHSILFERQQAAEVLVRPLEGVKTWEADEPHTLALYRQLRRRESEWEWEAVLRGARLLRKMGLWFAALELVRSWEFQDPREVALELRKASAGQTNGVQHTEPAAPRSMLDDFTTPAPTNTTAPPSMLDDFTSSTPPAKPSQPPSMLDGFANAPTSTQQDDKAVREAKAAELLKQLKSKKEAAKSEKEKRQPTQFQEPSADSLLDSFGF